MFSLQPWINIFTDIFFVQIFILYLIYLIYFTKNIYFILFYIFIQFLLLGLVLSIFNLDLFTAFLWLAESVIVFVSILMLFYLNVYGNVNKIIYKVDSIRYLGLFSIIGVIFFFFMKFLDVDNYYLYHLNYYILWDDFYEALFNKHMNDVYVLSISYYSLNSLELVIIGLILLFASIVCVNLNKFYKSSKNNNVYDLFNIFDFFKDIVKFSFLRKQNLTDQNLHNPSIKIFKKKISKKKGVK